MKNFIDSSPKFARISNVRRNREEAWNERLALIIAALYLFVAERFGFGLVWFFNGTPAQKGH